MKKDPLSLLFQFQKQVLDQKPSTLTMYREVKMMQFKIRPVHGDVARINLRNTKFIEILWSLGKLDEFFRITIDGILDEQKPIFFKIMDEMYDNLQQQLNALPFRHGHVQKNSPFVEMEIFKEQIPQKKSN